MNNIEELTFVIPLYGSEKTISKVISNIDNSGLKKWQAILVNDCSPDNVEASVKELIKKYGSKVTYLRLSKNGGQHKAILLGMKYVKYKYVAMIDDDGQNDPKDCIEMAKDLQEKDLDVVYGAFTGKKHNFMRRLISRVNRYVSKIAIGNTKGIPITNVRVITKQLADSLASLNNYFPYIGGMIFSLTSRIGFIYINHYERIEGTSGYNVRKLFKLWFNHLIGYSSFLLRLLVLAGLLVSIVEFLMGVAYLIITINSAVRHSGWLSIYLTMSFSFSLLFLFLAILAEYIGRTYLLHSNKTTTLISYKYNEE